MFQMLQVMSLKTHPLKYSIHTRLREFHLKRLFPNSPNGRLLDVGCGLGYLTKALGNDYCCVGLEYDINALKVNRDADLRNMVHGHATKLPFSEKSFDIVICSEVLEHLPEKQDEKVLLEMARVLKPGGHLLVTVPSLEGIRANSKFRNLGHDDPNGGEYHYRIGYSWKEMKALIERIPLLKLKKMRYAMFFFSELFMDAVKWIYFKKNKLKEHSDLIGLNDSLLFRLYRFFFPLIWIFFVCEEMVLSRFLKGHILIISLERTEK